MTQNSSFKYIDYVVIKLALAEYGRFRDDPHYSNFYGFWEYAFSLLTTEPYTVFIRPKDPTLSPLLFGSNVSSMTECDTSGARLFLVFLGHPLGYNNWDDGGVLVLLGCDPNLKEKLLSKVHRLSKKNQVELQISKNRFMIEEIYISDNFHTTEEEVLLDWLAIFQTNLSQKEIARKIRHEDIKYGFDENQYFPLQYQDYRKKIISDLPLLYSEALDSPVIEELSDLDKIVVRLRFKFKRSSNGRQNQETKIAKQNQSQGRIGTKKNTEKASRK